MSVNLISFIFFRYMKDINYYRKELDQLLARHQILQSDPSACSHDLKKQAEVIKESEAMIPDCETRLNAAKADLQEFMDNHMDEEEVTSSTIFKEAQSILSQ